MKSIKLGSECQEKYDLIEIGLPEDNVESLVHVYIDSFYSHILIYEISGVKIIPLSHDFKTRKRLVSQISLFRKALKDSVYLNKAYKDLTSTVDKKNWAVVLTIFDDIPFINVITDYNHIFKYPISYRELQLLENTLDIDNLNENGGQIE